jgi:hypothetical protein
MHRRGDFARDNRSQEMHDDVERREAHEHEKADDRD